MAATAGAFLSRLRCFPRNGVPFTVSDETTPMPQWSVAALGGGARVHALAAAMLEQGGQPAGWWLPPGQDASALPERLRKHFAPLPRWEELLVPDRVQVVLVGQGELEPLQEPLRHLVQQPLQLVVCHPLGLDWMFYYELAMHAQEGLGPPLAWNPLQWHPALEVVLARAERWSSPLERVVLQWEAPARAQAMQQALAEHLGLLRGVAGVLHSVSATALPGSEETWEHLELQLTGPQSPLVRWSARFAPQTHFKLELLARGHALVVEATDPLGTWQVNDALQGNLSLETSLTDCARRFARWWAKQQGVAPRAALKEDALRPPASPDDTSTDKASRPRLRVRPLPSPYTDWDAAARDLELVGAAQESLRRGRRIRLHEMQYSEQQVFRGLMSALGCGLLLLSLIVFVIGELVAGRMGWRWGRWWPGVLLVLLGGFLLLQLLQWNPTSPEKSPKED